MDPERHAVAERIEGIAREAFDKKLEDLDECELVAVWEMEAIFRLDGRASPIRHPRFELPLNVRRHSSST